MSHVFHEIYLHLNWHTKNDLPLLAGPMEKRVHDVLANRCRMTKGLFLDELGGADNHVHLAVNIEPGLRISDIVRQLKGGSAHDINEADGRIALQWQRGYGVVGFGKNNLPWVAEYVRNQRERHRTGRIQDRLERTGDDDGEDEDD